MNPFFPRKEIHIDIFNKGKTNFKKRMKPGSKIICETIL